jgi:hypothetical protein
MKESTKQGLGVIGVVVLASLAMQIPIVLAGTGAGNSQNPGYEVEVGNVTELFESPSPTPEPEVSVVPSPTRSIVPPRTLPPDPQNPENGGGMGGSISGRIPEDKGDDWACKNGDTDRCPSRAP